MIDIRGYFQIGQGNNGFQEHKNSIIMDSVNIECLEGTNIKIDDNNDKLCKNTGQKVNCPTKHWFDITGSGICVLQYDIKTKELVIGR